MTTEDDDNQLEPEVEDSAIEFKPQTNFTPEIQNPLEPLVDWPYGAVILGRGKRTHDKMGLKGTIQIGAVCEQQKGGKSLFGYKVRVDIEFPHIMFLCGKRGSGKSYSLGIFAEELARLRSGIGTVIIDPIGTFWSLKNPNKTPSEISALTRWGLEPRGFTNILTYTPIGFYNEYQGIVDKPFSIAPSDLTAEDWCLVFDVDRFKTQGLLIGDALEKVKSGYTAVYKGRLVDVPAKTDKYSIGDIIQCIDTDTGLTSRDEGFAQTTRRSMIARFTAASRWGLFATEGTPITELSVPNVVTVLDVSHPKIGDARRSLIVGIIARKILESRLAAARLEDATAMGMSVKDAEHIPVTWLLIDEAHLMLPHSRKTAASDALIEYAKLGRKPGCAMILATQRPSATNDEILSQVDLLIGHTLALQDDIAAFRKRVPAMLPKELGSSDFIRSIPVGIALLADQRTQKRTMLVQLRPRLTHHAGRAAIPVKGSEQPAEGDEDRSTEMQDEIDSGQGGVEDQEVVAQIKGPFREIDKPQPLQPTVHLGDLISGPGQEADTTRPGPAAKSEAGERTATGMTPVKQEVRPPVKTPAARAKETPARSERVQGQMEPRTGMFEADGVEYPLKDLEFDEGGLVLIRTKNVDAVFELYRAVSDRFMIPALSITRTHPKKISRYFESIKQTPEMFWLSKSTGEKNIGPTNLEKLAHQINRHIKLGSKGDGTGVPPKSSDMDASRDSSMTKGQEKPPLTILEGLEYLVSNNDFNKVLRFIETLHENVLLNKALGILPVNPSAMDERELEKLEREMDLCLTYSMAVKPETLTDENESGEATVEEETPPHGPAHQPPVMEKVKDVTPGFQPGQITGGLTLKEFKEALRNASKQELLLTCEKLGLPTIGTKQDLLKRIIKKLNTLKPEKGEDAAIKITPEDLLRGFEKEYHKLETERDKLRIEKEKIMRDKLKSVHDLEMAKLKNEREELLRKKKEQTEREKALLKREKDYEKRLSGLEKVARSQQGTRARSAGLGPNLSFEDPVEEDEEKGKSGNDIVGSLTVMPQIKDEALMEIILKKLDKNLFGKKREEISSVKPLFIPLLKTRISVPGGRLRRKDYVNEMIWDTISGELVIDFKNGLKRTEGLGELYELSQHQITVIKELSSFRSKETEDLIKDTGLTKAQLKRALNKLVDLGLIERKLDSTGKIEEYKRTHRLKLPGRPERVNFEMPELKPQKSTRTVLSPNYNEKQIKKILGSIVGNIKVIESENIYYPYYLVTFEKESKKKRKILIDAVAGIEDKLLGKSV